MSTKTVVEKLLIRPNSTVWLSHPERGDLIGPLPDGARIVDSPEQVDISIVFADNAASVRGIMGARKEQLAQQNTLWVAYPKGNRSDINRDTLWPILAEYGMRPISQIAIDEVWSALRFRPLKEGEAQFTGGR